MENMIFRSVNVLDKVPSEYFHYGCIFV